MIKKLFKNYYLLFLTLYFFHLIFSFILYSISHSNFLQELHNQEGIWKPFLDVSSYHIQAIRISEYFSSNFIGITEFITNQIPDTYNNNKHIKWLGLLYWLFNIHSYFVFCFITSALWSLCIIFTIKSSLILFNNFSIAIFSTSYFFFPSVITIFTQPMRDPFYYFYFVILIYFFVLFYENYKQNFINKSTIEFDKDKSNNYFNFNFKINTQNFKILFWNFLLLFISFQFLLFSREYMFVIVSFFVFIFIIFFTFRYLFYFSLNKNNNFVALDLTPIILLIFTIIFVSIFTSLQQSNKYARSMHVQIIKEEIIKVEEKNSNIKDELQNKKNNNINNDLLNECPEDVSFNDWTDSGKRLIDLCPKKSFVFYLNENFETIKNKILINYKTYSSIIPIRVSAMRKGFISMYGDNPSISYDLDKEGFKDFTNIITYFPRALQIALFSPFPNTFTDLSKSITMVLGASEMILIYFLYFGLIYFFITNFNSYSPMIPILILTMFIIIIIAYIVPYAGTLYRLRSTYLLFFFIFGVKGLFDLLTNLFKKNKNIL